MARPRALAPRARAAPTSPSRHVAGAEPPEAEPPEPPGDDDVVVMPIEDAIDLHTFAPRDVASVVEEYLHEAQLRGFREVRIIHGRGKGVQRRVVRASSRATRPWTASATPRPPAAGGGRPSCGSRRRAATSRPEPTAGPPLDDRGLRA